MASIVRGFSHGVSNLAAKIVYSTVEGYAFLFSKYGASVVFAAEAILLLRTAPHRTVGVGLQAATACIVGRAIWAFFHAAKESHIAPKDEDKDDKDAAASSIWMWEPPASDKLSSGAWHVLRELVVTATKMQQLYPEISALMSLPELNRPEELASRLYYFYVASESAGVSDYDFSDAKPVPEPLLDTLRAYQPLASFAYDYTNDGALGDALRTTGYGLVAAKYEPDITSGCPAYYLAMSNKNNKKNTDIEEIVLCIRGTYSPEDVFTDLLMVGVAFGGDEEQQPGRKGTAPAAITLEKQHVYNVHAGMAKAAFFLVEKFGAMLCRLRDSGVKVTLVGHSLGAGVASILALHLKQKKYGFDASTLQCLAFEPPALMDLPLALSCSDVVLSMVHADDIVPRMAVEPFAALLRELAAFDWQAEEKKEGNTLPTPLVLMHKLAGLVGSNVVAESANSFSEEDREALESKEESKYSPFVPGKVVFVCQDVEDKAVRVLLEPSSPVLRRIRLTSTIVTDHFIDKPPCMMALGEKLPDL
jgi:hypothetical protein